MDEYIRITESKLPGKIERARRDISDIEWKIERMKDQNLKRIRRCS
jgi:hypothetical protein|nr:MAG TPA_asm: hypothetical protein [Caudoviricetes sp.]